MADALDPKLVDKRVAQRYLKKGRLDEKDYKKHLESLPDLADQAEEVESEFEPSAAPRPTGPGSAAPSPDDAED